VLKHVPNRAFLTRFWQKWPKIIVLGPGKIANGNFSQKTTHSHDLHTQLSKSMKKNFTLKITPPTQPKKNECLENTF